MMGRQTTIRVQGAPRNDYQTNLDNVDRTAQTTANVLSVFSPQNIVSFAIAIVLLLLVLLLFRSSVKNLIARVAAPIKAAVAGSVAVAKAESKAGVKPTMDVDSARKMCGVLQTCFTGVGKNNASLLVTTVKDIANAADWELVNDLYGREHRRCNRMFAKKCTGGGYHDSLAETIRCQLSRDIAEYGAAKKSINAHLRSIGVEDVTF